MFIENNKVRYKYGVKIVKIELSVVKEGKVKNKIPEISSWTSSSTRGLSRCGGWCPGRCAARCHRPGPSPAASCTSRWPGRSSWWLRAKWPAVSPTSVLVSPCYRFSCCPQAPYGLVGWLEMEFLLFKLLSEASGLKSRKAPAWRLDSLQMMVAGIMVGKGVGLGGSWGVRRWSGSYRDRGDIWQRLLITGASIVVSNTSHIDTGIPGGLDLKVGSEKHQR